MIRLLSAVLATLILRPDVPARPEPAAQEERPQEVLRRAMLADGDDPAALLASLAAGADPNSSIEGVPPVALASGRGHVKKLLALLGAGGDPTDGGSGPSPLSRAAVLPDAGAARALLDAGASPSATDAQGRTALHEAVGKGAADVAQALLDAGADPLHKDAAGSTPADAAAARNDVAQILRQADGGRFEPSETVQRPQPGTDLQGISSGKTDGEVIQLAAGEYPGTLLARGRTLIVRGDPSGKTVLTGGTQDMCAYVDQKGRLLLENVVLRPRGKSVMGVYVSDGFARMDRVTVEDAKEQAAYVAQGRLSLRSCTLRRIEKIAVAAMKGSSLWVRDSVFTDCRNAAIHFQESASLQVTGCRFEGVQAPIRALKAGTVVIRRNAILHAREAVPAAPSIGLEGFDRLLATENVVQNPKIGLYAKTCPTGPVAIVDNSVLNAAFGLALELPREPGASAVRIGRQLVVNPSNVGMLLDGPSLNLLFRNLVLAEKGGAVAFRNKASSVIESSRLLAETWAVNFDKTEPAAAVLRRSLLWGDAPVQRENCDEPTLRLLEAARSPETGRWLGPALARVVGGADRLELRSMDAFTKTVDGFVGELASVHQAAARMAKVSLRLIDDAGISGVSDFDVYESRGEDVGSSRIAPADLKDPAGFVAAIRSGESPLARFLAEALLNGIPAEGPVGAEAVATVATRLSALVADPGFHKPERFASVRLSRRTRDYLDMRSRFGKDAPAGFIATLNRALLIDAYPFHIGPDYSLATGTSKSPDAFVRPGAYWLVPRAYPDFSQEVVLKERDHRVVDVSARGCAWIRLFNEGTAFPERLLLDLLPEAQRRDILARIDSGWRDWFTAGVERPEATDADRAAALDLARKRIRGLQPVPPDAAGKKPEEVDRLNGEYQAALRGEEAALRILAAVGTETDAALILDPVPPTPGGKRRRVLAAGHLERRLGILFRGAVRKAAGGGDPLLAEMARLELHASGLEGDDSALVAALKAGTQDGLQFDRADALLNRRAPEVREAMRVFLEVQAKFGVPRPAALYLLTYGTPEDRRRLAELPISPYWLPDLAALTRNPEEIAELLRTDFEALLRLSAGLRATPGAAERVVPRIEQICRDEGYRAAAPSEHPAVTSQARYARYCARVSAEFPNSTTAEYTFKKFLTWSDSPWSPVLDQYGRDQFLKLLRETPNFLTVHLDYLPPAELAKDAATVKSMESAPNGDLILAAHRVSTRAFFPPVRAVHDGVERRSFALAGGDGAVSGVLDVRPQWIDQRLRLSLRFTHSVYRHSGSFITRSWEATKYIGDGGRSLLGEVRLRRSGKALPLVLRERNGLTFVYEAPLDAAEFAGLLLDVEIAFFDKKHVLSYPLFDSDYARTVETLKSRAARWDAAVKSAPNDLSAWMLSARYHASMGKLSEAWERYRRAIALDGTRPEPWRAGIEMFSSRGEHGRAAAILREFAPTQKSDATPWTDLAAELYLAADYKGSAEAAAKALEIDPKDSNARLTQAMAAFLSGDRAAAARIAEELCVGAHRSRVLPLWFLSARTSGGAAEAATESLTREIADLKESRRAILLAVLTGKRSVDDALAASRDPADQCRSLTYDGYRRLLAGDRAGAKASFESALQTLEIDLLEYRMAQVEAGKLR